nr:MAG TPA: hypothetical protein [Caudoviricetes sp.]DAQ47569.1 MAG TPA: hypothetical protein [Caudoviricetes sp.]DAZ63369.1 MAG TPA: hypothetical protein [Caudoviricetes sp.]
MSCITIEDISLSLVVVVPLGYYLFYSINLKMIE